MKERRFRSKSPFARRGKDHVKGLLDEVKKKEQDLLMGDEVSSLGADLNSYSTPTAMSAKNSVPSTSTSSSNHRDSKEESPHTAKQDKEKKGRDERGVREARQSEHSSGSAARLSIREFYESALASQQANWPARGRGSSPRRRERIRNNSKGAASPWNIEDTTIEMIYTSPVRRRAKSTPQRERRPSAAAVVVTPPAPSNKDASTAKTPSTAGTSSTSRRGRSKSPFRRWRKAEDLVKDVRRKEELAAVVAATPSTAASTSRMSAAAAVAVTPSTAASSSRLSTAATRSSSLETPTRSSSSKPRQSRSRSPFRRFRKTEELLRDVNLVENDFARELQRQSSPGKRHNWLPSSPLRRFNKSVNHAVVADKKKCNGNGGEDDEVEVVLKTPPRAAAALSPFSSPKAATEQVVVIGPSKSSYNSQKRKSFRDRFMPRTKPQTTVIAAERTPERRPVPGDTVKLGSHTHRKPNVERSPNIKSSTGSKSSVLPQTIQCRRVPVSDLSVPLQRHRSIGEDSARQVRKALGKVHRDLGGPDSTTTKSSKKSIGAVMKALVEVTNKLESEADRKAMLEALGRLEVGQKHPPIIMEAEDGSDSSESSSCYQRRIDRAIQRGEIAETDSFDDGSSHSSNSEDSDASSFTRWETNASRAQGILAMFGLTNLLWGGDTDSIIDDQDGATSDGGKGSSYSVREVDDFGCLSDAVCVADPEREIKREPVAVDEIVVDGGERMLRELEQLDRRIQVEAKREAQRGTAKIQRKKIQQTTNDENTLLKERLDQRRKKQIELNEKRTAIEATEGPQQQPIITEVTRPWRQDYADSQKNTNQKEEARTLLLKAKAEKLQRAEQENRERGKCSHPHRPLVAKSFSSDTDSISFPKPPPQTRLSHLDKSFRPRREDETYSSATSENRPISPFVMDDALSLGSVDSSQFGAPRKSGKEDAPGYVM